MIKLRFLPAAETDLLKEIYYYSSIQRDLGIGFRDAVMNAVAKAVANPDSGAPFAKNTRRRLVKRFPFSVVYRTSAVELLVVAIVDQRRKPEYWAHRVN